MPVAPTAVAVKLGCVSAIKINEFILYFARLAHFTAVAVKLGFVSAIKINGAPDKPCGVGRADANPKLLLNDT